jgi:hypothetical protein
VAKKSRTSSLKARSSAEKLISIYVTPTSVILATA